VNDRITATATMLSSTGGFGAEIGSTSEFSANRTVTSGAGRLVSGTVYEDVDSDGNVFDAGTQRVAGATVRLYRDSDDDGQLDGTDAFLGTVTTNATGDYNFSGLAAARYWVVVDSRTINPSNVYNAGSGLGNVWAEQTYGVDGANNTAGTTFTGGASVLFGGRRGTTSDDASTLLGSEHIDNANANLADATGRNFGFSFQVVTNTLAGDGTDHDGSNPRTVQGSLRQFIDNANAIAGAATMRFVPAVAPDVVNGPAFTDDGNYTNDGGDDWWQITVSTALPAITDSAGTTIDGTAYSRFDGVTLANTNAGVLGNPGMQVGLGADTIAGTLDDPTLPGVPRPELELVDGANVDWGLKVGASNVTIRYFSIHGFGDDPIAEADVVIGDAAAPQNHTAIVVEDNVIGSGPASFADPGANRSMSGIAVFAADSGFIRRNLIGFANDWGIQLGGVVATTRTAGRSNRTRSAGPGSSIRNTTASTCSTGRAAPWSLATSSSRTAGSASTPTRAAAAIRSRTTPSPGTAPVSPRPRASACTGPAIPFSSIGSRATPARACWWCNRTARPGRHRRPT
jgi:hypothetical protein